VAITPAAGYVTPVGSIFVGFIAGIVCASVTGIKGKIGIDDALDVGAVHLVGGSLGALLIGFWGSSDTGGEDGFFYGGGFDLLGKQAVAVASVVIYSFVVTLVIGAAIRMFVRMRMSVDEEKEGMDIALHGERAYDF
jgi:Amt family ammonium transporter